MNLLYMLLSLVLIVIATLAYQKLALIREGFLIPYANTESSTCAANLTSNMKDGIVICNDKEGLPVCTLTPNDSTRQKQIPPCQEIIQQYYDGQAAKFCPPSMKNYFEDPANKTSGCTSGVLNSTRTAPENSTAIQCAIYESDLDTITQTSCFNQKQLETTPLFGDNPTKILMPITIKDPPPYITVVSYERTGTSMKNMCVPEAHATHIINYMRKNTDKTLPAEKQATEMAGWKIAEDFIKTGKFIGSCEAQKKVYVDRTMQESDLVPKLGEAKGD
jgi:hypothetical protein